MTGNAGSGGDGGADGGGWSSGADCCGAGGPGGGGGGNGSDVDMSVTCVTTFVAAATDETAMLVQLVVIVGGSSPDVDVDAAIESVTASGAGSCCTSVDIAVVGGSVRRPVGTSVASGTSVADVVVVVKLSNGLMAVEESKKGKFVNVLRTGRGPRLLRILGFTNGFTIVDVVLSSFPPEAVRSPGSRSGGLSVPVESLRDVVLVFVFETNVVVGIVDKSGFVSVANPVEGASVLILVLDGMDRAKCAGESLF